jgi:hypothetical protein
MVMVCYSIGDNFDLLVKVMLTIFYTIKFIIFAL